MADDLDVEVERHAEPEDAELARTHWAGLIVSLGLQEVYGVSIGKERAAIAKGGERKVEHVVYVGQHVGVTREEALGARMRAVALLMKGQHR